MSGACVASGMGAVPSSVIRLSLALLAGAMEWWWLIGWGVAYQGRGVWVSCAAGVKAGGVQGDFRALIWQKRAMTRAGPVLIFRCCGSPGIASIRPVHWPLPLSFVAGSRTPLTGVLHRADRLDVRRCLHT